MRRTTFRIDQMDCAAEEEIVRMSLDGIPGVNRLEFDIPARQVVVYHTALVEAISSAIDATGLGARRVGQTITVDTVPDSEPGLSPATESNERRPLLAALAINGSLFVGEALAGLLAGSMGLVADALDMLADASVYALSLVAVGGSVARKKRLAGWSGYLQGGLAVFGMAEVLRRFAAGDVAPDVATMIIVAAIALLGNVATLMILRKAARGEPHVEASWIFTSNDVKVNVLVMASGALVWLTDSGIPDLLAGGFIFAIVARGAWRILRLSR